MMPKREPITIRIEFDVEIGDDAYVKHFIELYSQLVFGIYPKIKPHHCIVNGDINIAFYDGHRGINQEMLELVAGARKGLIEDLQVKCPGWGISAFGQSDKGKYMHVVFKASQQHEYHYELIARDWFAEPEIIRVAF